MPNKQQRQQNAANYGAAMRKLPTGRKCGNCNKPLNHGEGHYVPPSFGESGFFWCSAFAKAGAIA